MNYFWVNTDLNDSAEVTELAKLTGLDKESIVGKLISIGEKLLVKSEPIPSGDVVDICHQHYYGDFFHLYLHGVGMIDFKDGSCTIPGFRKYFSNTDPSLNNG
jgi:hypothetical protein